MGFHAYTRPANYVLVTTGTLRHFVADADRVAGKVRVWFGYGAAAGLPIGPVHEHFDRSDAVNNITTGKAPSLGAYGQAWGSTPTDSAIGTTGQVGYPSLIIAGGYADAGIDCYHADQDVTVVCKASSGHVGMKLRAPTGTNFVGVYLDLAAGFVKVRTGMSRSNTATGTLVFTGATPIVADTYYTLRAVVVGNNYLIYVNGVLEGTFTSSANNTATSVGLIASHASARWTSFVVAKNANPAATAYSVRNWDGDILDSGVVADDHIDIDDALLTWRGRGPYGWYRVYLTGPDHGDGQWGTAYGDMGFCRYRDEDPTLIPATGPATADAQFIVADAYAHNSFMPNVTRLGMSSLTTGTVAANDAWPIITAPLLKIWKDLQSAARSRHIIGAFPNGTSGTGIEGPGGIVRQTVALLGPLGVDGWEPINEPAINAATFATTYMPQFHTDVKAADPAALVLGPNPVTYNRTYLPAGWIENFLAAGGGAYLDGFSVHSYNCTNGDLALARECLANLMAALAAHSFTGPVFQTEQGFSHQQNGLSCPNHAARWNALAVFVSELYGLRLENNSYWYDFAHGFDGSPMYWLDAPGSGPGGSLQSWSPGPQALPTRVMAAEIANRPLETAFDFGTHGNQLYAGGRWTAGGTSTVGLMAASSNATPLICTLTGATSVVISDTWGNTFTLAATLGKITVPVTELPVWIRCPAGVTVAPDSLGLTTDLAQTGTISSTGSATNIARVNDGSLRNQYGDSSASWTAPNAPYNDRSGVLPQTITVDFGGAVTANRLILHGFPPWQDGGVPTDFDIDTFDGTTWTTRYTHTPPASKTFPFASASRCTTETFWDERYIWDVVFPTTSITRARVVVRAVSYGGFETAAARVTAFGGTAPQYVIVRAIQAFNATAAVVATDHNLLLEDGSHTLIEDGSALLIEESTTTITGTIAVTLAGATSVASGSSTTGTISATLAGATMVATGTVTVPAAPIVILRPSVDDVLDGRVPNRTETFRFDAWDNHGTLLGPIAVDWQSPPTIANNARNAIRRTVSGLTIKPRPLNVPVGTRDTRGLPWYYAEDLDSLTMRVKVWWVSGNAGVELQYGEYLFSDDSQDIHTEGNPRHCQLDDLCALLVDELPQNIGFGTGTNVGTALAALFDVAGITNRSIDSTGVTLSAPLGWTIERDTLMTAFDALCPLAGFLPVYFNNSGGGRCRAAPDLQNSSPDFTYGPDTTMIQGSIVVSRNLLKVPNRYRVMDSAGSTLVGQYDIPDASPNSIVSRGRVIAKTMRVPGLGGPVTDDPAVRQARADAAAKAFYIADPNKYATLAWSTLPDPRNDTFNIARYGGVNFMQLATSMVCKPGAAMSHEASGSLIPA